MKRTSLLLAALGVTVLAGCEPSHVPKAWVARKELPAYKSPEGDAQVVAFKLYPGDVCVPGEKVVEKVFSYTEVVCPGRGYGWVADYDFDTVSKETLSARPK